MWVKNALEKSSNRLSDFFLVGKMKINFSSMKFSWNSGTLSLQHFWQVCCFIKQSRTTLHKVCHHTRSTAVAPQRKAKSHRRTVRRKNVQKLPKHNNCNVMHLPKVAPLFDSRRLLWLRKQFKLAEKWEKFKLVDRKYYCAGSFRRNPSSEMPSLEFLARHRCEKFYFRRLVLELVAGAAARFRQQPFPGALKTTRK